MGGCCGLSLSVLISEESRCWSSDVYKNQCNNKGSLKGPSCGSAPHVAPAGGFFAGIRMQRYGKVVTRTPGASHTLHCCDHANTLPSTRYLIPLIFLIVC